MNNDEPVDYFVHVGYRKMVIHLMKSAAEDLLLNSEKAGAKERIAEAMAWVSFDPDLSVVAQPGLTFSDCVIALGVASDVDAYRRGFLSRPKDVLRECQRALDAMNAAEGVFTDTKIARKPETLATEGSWNGWLFGDKASSAHASGA